MLYPDLPLEARAAFRRDLVTGVLTAGTVAMVELGAAMARKAFGASDLEVALSRAAYGLGLLSSAFSVRHARRAPAVPMAFRLILVANLALVGVALAGASARAFVLLVGCSGLAWAMASPARIVVYGRVFPDPVRGALVGILRRAQLAVVAILGLGLSILLDAAAGEPELDGLLGGASIDPIRWATIVVPLFGVAGIVGGLVFRTIRESAAPELLAPSGRPLGTLLGDCVRVLRDDVGFRRYQCLFMVLGTANIMTTPVVDLFLVDELGARYIDIAVANVVIVQGTMALTLPWWGRRVDLHHPMVLRGWLNLLLASDLVVLAFASRVEWVFVGRVFRGLALSGGSLVWMLGSLRFARRADDAAVYTTIHTVLTGVRWCAAPLLGIAIRRLAGGESRFVFAVGATVLVAVASLLFVAARGLPTDAARSDGR